MSPECQREETGPVRPPGALGWPPGPPPEWWRLWHPPAREQQPARVAHPSLLSQVWMWRTLAAAWEKEGRFDLAARALREAEAWERVAGIAPPPLH
ncbi:MAG: hypothetical protein IMX02_10210 [Limnochordaceae bacterium]|nr:hypothetical protein [Limnochordaceae bacterium]